MNFYKQHIKIFTEKITFVIKNFMKKILGLDLGASSIGWALVCEKDDGKYEFIDAGVRLIPIDSDDLKSLFQQNAKTKNQERTEKRQMRRRLYRFYLRRRALMRTLNKYGMWDDSLMHINKNTLWELRANAACEKIDIKLLGRILYHINQRRGYSTTKLDEDHQKQVKKYEKDIFSRYDFIKQHNLTVGQYFWQNLKENPHYRVKEQIFPRKAYIEEYNTIMSCQQKFYPNILTDELIAYIRDKIIFYQRKLKSQKDKVNTCRFEGFTIKNRHGKEIFVGPKVAARSNPLFQIDRIWEQINNISLKHKINKTIFEPTLDQKKQLFEKLNKTEKVSFDELCKIFKLKKEDWYPTKNLSKGLTGNTTIAKIKKIIQHVNNYEKHLKLELNIVDKQKTFVDRETGEIITKTIKQISSNVINEPLYVLWHTLYSIKDPEKCSLVLQQKFGFEEQIANKLAKVDFVKAGYGHKSVKAIRRVLPYLMEGHKFSDAAKMAGYNHTKNETQEKNIQKPLEHFIPLLEKNSLRQPIVEKVLNQMILLVNEIINPAKGYVTTEERENGQFEIRIELARELKASKKERMIMYNNILRNEKENRKAAEEIEKMGIPVTSKTIQKYKLFKETNGMCVYTGRTMSLADALTGTQIDIDHIIPQTLLPDNSMQNLVLVYSEANREKGNMTAYDYMKSKGEEAFSKYLERIKKLFDGKKITQAKYERLKMSASEIPQDFINRQIRDTQYISVKARDVLGRICRNVHTTTGSVTAILRRIWGWDDVLNQLRLEKIRELIPVSKHDNYLEKDFTESDDGEIVEKIKLKDWTKRDDHRHHAIDALVVACTKQGYIQRINTLAAKETRQAMYSEVIDGKASPRKTLFQEYFLRHRPFDPDTVKNIMRDLLISIKSGKKVATWGKQVIRKGKHSVIVQSRVLVPRGPLHEESFYGVIKILEKGKNLKYLFENHHLIFKPYIRELVEKRLEQFHGNVKEALQSVKKEPIYLDQDRKVKLEYATCYKEQYVIRYPLKSLENEDQIQYIVDAKIREILRNKIEEKKNELGKDYKFKEVLKEPVYLDEKCTIPIKHVRMITGLRAVEPIRYDSEGRPITFVKPGNNHHFAIYEDMKTGELKAHICSLWHAVERKKYGLPVIIEDANAVYQKIQGKNIPEAFIKKLPQENWVLKLSLQQNECFIIILSNFHNREAELRFMQIIREGIQNNIETREIIDTIKKENLSYLFSKYMYRVQKISLSNGIEITFRLLTDSNSETNYTKARNALDIHDFLIFQSLRRFSQEFIVKCRLDIMGKIKELGCK